MNSRMMISSVLGNSILSVLVKILGKTSKISVSPHKNTLSKSNRSTWRTSVKSTRPRRARYTVSVLFFV